MPLRANMMDKAKDKVNSAISTIKDGSAADWKRWMFGEYSYR